MSRINKVTKSIIKVSILSLGFAALFGVVLQQSARAQAKSFAYRISNVQVFSEALGAKCVPAYIMQNKTAHQGVFIVTAPTTELGRNLRLSAGMVLLTVDNYTMLSAKAIDGWLKHRTKHGPITITYAVDNNGVASVLSASAEAAPSVAASSAPAPRVVVSAGSASSKSDAPKISTVRDASIDSDMVALLNQSRAAGGLAPLHLDSTLGRFGQSYANYLAANAEKYNVMDDKSNPHTDLNGRGFEERAKSAGVSVLNENIGRNTAHLGSRSLKVLHDQMMASPGHRPAIMDPEARSVGIGAAFAGPRLFLVEEFGR